MNLNLLKEICKCIAVCMAFACVTLAAAHFDNVRILWWYILPLFMGVVYSATDEKKGQGK